MTRERIGSRALLRKLAPLVPALLVGLVAQGFARADAGPKLHTIEIRGFTYTPEKRVVKLGDVVVWTNRDIVPHTATGKEKGFDSGTLGDGGSWRYTPAQRGEYSYDCAFHPNMKGTLVVR
ncbi:MAG: cupredoxin family copper-binding protein [Gemmatimonadetes bacterium]|nr:cupredoxin family copper-binding protein [Gemmatimonadota bacterium]